jgi:hypothetical protein
VRGLKHQGVLSDIRNDDGVCVELKFREQDVGVSGRIAELLDEP